MNRSTRCSHYLSTPRMRARPGRAIKFLREIRRALLLAAAWWAVLAAGAGAAAASAYGAESCGPGLVAKVQQAYQAIGSFQAAFTQEDRRADGGVGAAEGTIAYHKPGRMRWEYAPPNEQLLVTDGETVWLFDPLLENVTVEKLAELTQGTPLAFLLGVGSLARDFACRPFTVPPPEDGLTYLELTANASIPGLDFIQLGVAPADARLTVLRMIDKQGNLRQVTLRAMETGVTFPAGHFTFLMEEGMEVITK